MTGESGNSSTNKFQSLPLPFGKHGCCVCSIKGYLALVLVANTWHCINPLLGGEALA